MRNPISQFRERVAGSKKTSGQTTSAGQTNGISEAGRLGNGPSPKIAEMQVH